MSVPRGSTVPNCAHTKKIIFGNRFFLNFCPSLNAVEVLCSYCQFINIEYLSFWCDDCYAFHSVGLG